jgi:hypothetical protein
MSGDPDLLNVNTNVTRFQKYMWHSVEHRFSYCGIAKVGSSTWANHLVTLGGKKKLTFKTRQ